LQPNFFCLSKRNWEDEKGEKAKDKRGGGGKKKKDGPSSIIPLTDEKEEKRRKHDDVKSSRRTGMGGFGKKKKKERKQPYSYRSPRPEGGEREILPKKKNKRKGKKKGDSPYVSLSSSPPLSSES